MFTSIETKIQAKQFKTDMNNIGYDNLHWTWSKDAENADNQGEFVSYSAAVLAAGERLCEEDDEPRQNNELVKMDIVVTLMIEVEETGEIEGVWSGCDEADYNYYHGDHAEHGTFGRSM